MHSIEKRRVFKIRQNPIFEKIMELAKGKDLVVDDNIETVMIRFPNSTFTCMLSRVSTYYQFYLLGDGHNFYLGKIVDVNSAEEFLTQAYEYKSRLEGGEVVRQFVLSPDEDEEDYIQEEDQGFIVICKETKQSQFFKTKKEIETYLNCSRPSIDGVLKGSRALTKGHYIKSL